MREGDRGYYFGKAPRMGIYTPYTASVSRVRYSERNVRGQTQHELFGLHPFSNNRSLVSTVVTKELEFLSFWDDLDE